MRDKYRELYRERSPIRCTNCKYCQPCPSGVNIPRIFEIYNEAIMFNDYQVARMRYGWIEEEHGANLCVQCGRCLELCPQQIEIPEWLAKAHELLKRPWWVELETLASSARSPASGR